MTITIKRRTQAQWLVFFMVFFPFCLGTLNDLLGLPYSIRYAMDIAWVGALAFLGLKTYSARRKSISKLAVWVTLFLLYTGFVYIVKFQSPLYYLWGIRNNFRFYITFFAFSAFLTCDDTERYFNIFDKLFWLNVLVSLIQYFVFGIEQDFLGGIFGVQDGVNGYTNLFFLIVITRSIVLFLEKKESASACVCKCVAALFVAALAELKFFFVEFLMIIALAVLITNFSWRKFLLIVGGVPAAFVGASLMVVFFPSYAGWFSLEYILDVVTSERGYTSTGDLNRLTAIGSINELWLRNWGQRLFGLGLGNCETSSFELLNTPFYRQHGDMHYNWISYAHMYLECGWIGLVFFFGFFAIVFICLQHIKKQADSTVRTYCRIAQVMAIMSVVIAVYNSSLRFEPAYMLYFALAVPFAMTRRRNGSPRQI